MPIRLSLRRFVTSAHPALPRRFCRTCQCLSSRCVFLVRLLRACLFKLLLAAAQGGAVGATLMGRCPLWLRGHTRQCLRSCLALCTRLMFLLRSLPLGPLLWVVSMLLARTHPFSRLKSCACFALSMSSEVRTPVCNAMRVSLLVRCRVAHVVCRFSSSVLRMVDFATVSLQCQGSLRSRSVWLIACERCAKLLVRRCLYLALPVLRPPSVPYVAPALD